MIPEPKLTTGSRARLFTEYCLQFAKHKRRLVQSAVEPTMSTLMAIPSSLAPASAASGIWARLSLRAGCLPPLRSP
jgi:hypothetical protein